MISPFRWKNEPDLAKPGLSLITTLFSLCMLAACGAAPALAASSPTLPPPPPTPTSLPAMTQVPPTATASATFAANRTPSPRPPTAAPALRLCSPLEDITLTELPSIIAGNTYQTPQPGRDDGHPGVDFAYYSHGTHKTMLGLPLKSAMAGRVAAVIPDRKPYGNTVIIEVPLDQVPPEWLASLNWPTPAPTVVPDPRLTCPSPLQLPQWDATKRSLYLLYGHLNKYSSLRVGESVACGQIVGEVGTTGASVNPHLHFEARLGPAGAAIPSFGHYDAHTTAEERNNYCLWRVSNWFQLIDPVKILAQQP